MQKITSNGYTLIEVLISLMLLSLALLALDASQITSLNHNRAAYFSAVAENQLQNMSEQLKASLPNPSLPEVLANWNSQNATVLPKGIGSITGNFPSYTLTIAWGNENPDHCKKSNSGQSGCITEEVIM